jgi:hypothetical protein
VRGVAVAGGFRLNAGASFRTLVLSRRLAALGYCLPLDQKRRLPRCTNFGVPSHGLFTRCLRFAAFLPPQRLYGHARLAPGWWSTLAGWDWLPTRSLVKFQRSLHMHPPHHRLCLSQWPAWPPWTTQGDYSRGADCGGAGRPP